MGSIIKDLVEVPNLYIILVMVSNCRFKTCKAKDMTAFGAHRESP